MGAIQQMKSCTGLRDDVADQTTPRQKLDGHGDENRPLQSGIAKLDRNAGPKDGSGRSHRWQSTNAGILGSCIDAVF
jgi:hypothetical protein